MLSLVVFGNIGFVFYDVGVMLFNLVIHELLIMIIVVCIVLVSTLIMLICVCSIRC